MSKNRHFTCLLTGRIVSLRDASLRGNALKHGHSFGIQAAPGPAPRGVALCFGLVGEVKGKRTRLGVVDCAVSRSREARPRCVEFGFVFHMRPLGFFDSHGFYPACYTPFYQE